SSDPGLREVRREVPGVGLLSCRVAHARISALRVSYRVMLERPLGTIVLCVEHRAPGSEGGPTLRGRRAADGRELLRFDCFARGAHWHQDPGGRDEITVHPEGRDALEWTLAELRRDLAGYVARAGGRLEAAQDE